MFFRLLSFCYSEKLFPPILLSDQKLQIELHGKSLTWIVNAWSLSPLTCWVPEHFNSWLVDLFFQYSSEWPIFCHSNIAMKFNHEIASAPCQLWDNVFTILLLWELDFVVSHSLSIYIYMMKLFISLYIYIYTIHLDRHMCIYIYMCVIISCIRVHIHVTSCERIIKEHVD